MFKDRIDAAEKLAVKLEEYRNTDSVILALPRGGVPIGYVIANTLDLPLDVVLSKKIGHPLHKEYAIGSVSLEGRNINLDVAVSKEYIEEETERIRNSLREKYKLYMGNRKPMQLKNKNVIIIDDGLATGNTIITTIELIKKSMPGKIIVAVPVAPKDTLAKIRKMVDKVVCLMVPEYFIGVGQFYENFYQVSDQEVVELLEKISNKKLNVQ